MLKLSLQALNAIAQGVKPTFAVTIYFQKSETYTESDYLINAGDIATSMSSDQGYQIGNSTVTLKNSGQYFSRKFAKELPNNKLIEIYMIILDEQTLVMRGIITKDWKLTPTLLTLNINA